MERLTKRSENGTGVYATPSGDPIKWDDNRHKVLQKLADYEDLAEQGRLLILQFRVGDRVWDDEFKSVYRITGYSFGTAEDYIHDPVSETEVVYYCTNYCGSITGSFSESEIGKTMFHSEEEAEAALEKMKGEEHE